MSGTQKTSVRRERRHRKLNELLRELIGHTGNEYGAVTRLAEIAQTQRSHMSAMLADRRGVGDELADRLERKCLKPTGWFDDQAGSAPPAQPIPAREHGDQLIAALDYLVLRIRAIDDVTREAVAPLLSRLATQPEDQAQITRVLVALMPAAGGLMPAHPVDAVARKAARAKQDLARVRAGRVSPTEPESPKERTPSAHGIRKPR